MMKKKQSIAVLLIMLVVTVLLGYTVVAGNSLFLAVILQNDFPKQLLFLAAGLQNLFQRLKHPSTSLASCQSSDRL